MFKTRLNNISTGLIIGLVLPIIALLILYVNQFSGLETNELIEYLNSKEILTPIMSLCVVPNLLAFFLFIWTNRLLSARGVLLATFLMAAIIIIIKFVV